MGSSLREHRVEGVAERRPHPAPLQRGEATRGDAAGRGDLAAHGKRVIVAPAQQLCGAGERLGDELGGLAGGMPRRTPASTWASATRAT